MPEVGACALKSFRDFAMLSKLWSGFARHFYNTISEADLKTVSTAFSSHDDESE